MSLSRRSVLVAAGSGIASTTEGIGAPALAPEPRADHELADLIWSAADAHAALMRGDLDTYRRRIAISNDFTLMSPFGGRSTRGAELSNERWVAIARFFANGRDARFELIEAYRSSDITVLVASERAHVEVGGLPGQDWSLRVTLVFRRAGDRWLLAHRHADPLVKGISLKEAAAITLGLPPS